MKIFDLVKGNEVWRYCFSCEHRRKNGFIIAVE
jgi:hypothetical protein